MKWILHGFLYFLSLTVSTTVATTLPESWQKQSTPPPSYYVIDNKQDDNFLLSLKSYIEKRTDKGGKALQKAFEESSFAKDAYGYVITVYRHDGKRKRFIATGEQNVFAKLVALLAKDKRTRGYTNIRVQFDLIQTRPKIFDYLKSKDNTLTNRFEMGVDGLIISKEKKRKLFLPGDAFIYSLLSHNQLNKKIKKWFKKTKLETLTFKKLRSQSYISYGDKWVPLYRGYPVIAKPVSTDDIQAIVNESMSYVLQTMRADGRFLYYYEAAKDSERDHQHPKRDPRTNPYYNIIRHAGATSILLNHYEVTKDKRALDAVKKALEFLKGEIRYYELASGEKAAYVFYNKKAKLGAQGLALYAMSRYYALSGDTTFNTEGQLLSRHLLNSIYDDGEFQYYSIYLNKTLTRRENPYYFSFYYPGEALLGMIYYYEYLANPTEKAQLKIKIEKAFQFLLKERPRKYADYYASLPSDSWLMNAGFHWLDHTKTLTKAIKAFIYSDADKMVNHMYSPLDSLYPDYDGAFYYNYGDHPYPDAARGEGLIMAYALALKEQDTKKIAKYEQAVQALNWSVMHLFNSDVSTYAVKNKEKTMGGIRFKLTRQWFRVDTIQHVVAYYQVYLGLLKEYDLS